MTTTMINPHANGRRRASLNEQINRLDNMLDGLSEGLNEAVADAVRAAVGTAVREAVQAVLKEVLTNPEIRAKLQPISEPPAKEPINSEIVNSPPTPMSGQEFNDWRQRARVCVAKLRTACAQSMDTLRTKTAQAWQWSCTHLSDLWERRDTIRPFKRQLLTALGIGLLVAVLVWYAGPWIAAIVGGIGGFFTTVTVQAALWLRRAFAENSESVA